MVAPEELGRTRALAIFFEKFFFSANPMEKYNRFSREQAKKFS